MRVAAVAVLLLVGVSAVAAQVKKPPVLPCNATAVNCTLTNPKVNKTKTVFKSPAPPFVAPSPNLTIVPIPFPRFSPVPSPIPKANKTKIKPSPQPKIRDNSTKPITSPIPRPLLSPVPSPIPKLNKTKIKPSPQPKIRDNSTKPLTSPIPMPRFIPVPSPIIRAPKNKTIFKEIPGKDPSVNPKPWYMNRPAVSPNPKQQQKNNKRTAWCLFRRGTNC